MRRCVLGLICLCLVGPMAARAQDKIFLKNKEKYLGQKSKADFLAAKVQSEAPDGIRVAGYKELIPAEDIVDIEYVVDPIEVRLNVYRPAFDADLKVHNPKLEAERKKNLAAAIKGYQDALGKLAGGQDFARRNVEYRLGELLAQQARDNPADAPAAVAKLKEFKSKFADGWQIVRAMQLLANLQLDHKQFADAETTFEELSALAKVPEAVRQEARLSAARVGIRAGKHPEALKKLDRLIAEIKLPKDHPLVTRARVAQAECLTADKTTLPKGRAVLRDIIKDTTDKGVKATAYNTLGVSYFAAGEFKEARWEFLWVDVVYNQDRAEHARALYYLWRTFKELGENERAQECLETLLSDRQFAGLEYQLIAQREGKL
jgi:hypothetical protein